MDSNDQESGSSSAKMPNFEPVKNHTEDDATKTEFDADIQDINACLASMALETVEDDKRDNDAIKLCFNGTFCDYDDRHEPEDEDDTKAVDENKKDEDNTKADDENKKNENNTKAVDENKKDEDDAKAVDEKKKDEDNTKANDEDNTKALDENKKYEDNTKAVESKKDEHTSGSGHADKMTRERTVLIGRKKSQKKKAEKKCWNFGACRKIYI